MRKLLVASQKSGVGKTTTSMNLAAATALTGTRVLLVDADPLCNISTALNLVAHPRRQPLRQAGIDLPGVFVPNIIPGLDVVCPYDEGACTDDDFARVLRVLAAPPLRQCYGCTIVDVPPFLGGSAAELLASCDDYLLVVRAEEMAYRTLPAFLELVQRSSRDGCALPMRGILLTLPAGEEPGCRLERELRGRFGSRVLPEVIPHDDRIGEALRTGSIGSQLYPDSPAARQYQQLVAKLDLAEGKSPRIEVEAIVQVLREATELAGSESLPDPTPHLDCPASEAPIFASFETVKPAMSSPRPRRLGRSADSMRPARPERVGSPSLVSSPPHNTTHALAQLWPLWILLGAVLGGGLRLLPLSPSLLPVFIGLGAALLVAVVLSIRASQKQPAASTRNKKSGWLRSRQPKKSTPVKETRQDSLSARLTSLVNDTKRVRRSTDDN